MSAKNKQWHYWTPHKTPVKPGTVYRVILNGTEYANATTFNWARSVVVGILLEDPEADVYVIKTPYRATRVRQVLIDDGGKDIRVWGAP